MQNLKKIKLLHLLIIGFALVYFTSCKDDKPEDTVGEATVTALVDGDAWQSSPHGPHSPVGAVGMINTAQNINIQAYASDGSYISINVLSTSAIQENTVYTAESGLFQAQFKPDFLSTDAYSTVIEGATGTIRFTNISSKKISGTFSFNGLKPGGGSTAVDNGSFNMDL